jgi:serine/threonine-protein kinase HipA
VIRTIAVHLWGRRIGAAALGDDGFVAFLMDRSGTWSLAPAYDVTWSYNPRGEWTDRHRMSVAGKRDDFTLDDLLAAASAADISATRARRTVERVRSQVATLPEIANDVGVESALADAAIASLRPDL